MHEVVSHKCCIADQIFEFEFQKFLCCLFLIDQIQGVNLFEHFFLDNLAPDLLHGVRPAAAHASQLEQFSRVEGQKDVALEHLRWNMLNRGLRQAQVSFHQREWLHHHALHVSA